MEKLIKIYLTEDIISCYPGDCFALFIYIRLGKLPPSAEGYELNNFNLLPSSAFHPNSPV